jgi:hypothetical protein
VVKAGEITERGGPSIFLMAPVICLSFAVSGMKTSSERTFEQEVGADGQGSLT